MGHGQAAPAPAPGSIFLDPRGEDRSLRVTWHHDSGLVVLSLWRDNVCAGTFRLAADEVPDLIACCAPGSTRRTTPPRAAERRRRPTRPADPAGLSGNLG